MQFAQDTWQQYRKGLIPTQALILTICALALIVAKIPALSVLLFLLILEGFSIFGAMWGIRLRGKFVRSKAKKERLTDLMK